MDSQAEANVPFVSAASWRRWLRDTLIEETGLKPSTIRARGNTDKIGSERNPIEGPGEREVNIPEGMKIFIPLLGVVATEFESPNSSVPDLKALAEIDQKCIKELSVELKDQQSICSSYTET